MIVVKIMDGLGNQMFQYAFSKYLQEVYHEPIIFDTTKIESNLVRNFGLDKLNIDIVDRREVDDKTCAIATNIENQIFKIYSKFIRITAEKLFNIKMTGEKSYHKMIKLGFYTTNDSILFYPFKKTIMPIKFIRGYFQSERYFENIANKIKEELRVRESCAINSEFQKLLNDTNSICVHIRRGDYVGNKTFEVCDENYYIEAMNYMINNVKNPIFFVFSNTPDDLEWIRNNYDLPGTVNYVTQGEDEFQDLFYMYNCKHHIISNSTFSWWGSFLSLYEENITICPEKWNNFNLIEQITRKNWIKL